jgi:hypothetical protein
MSWVDVLTPFGTAAAGAAAVYGTVVRPRQKEHEKQEAARKEQRRISDGFLFGVKGIEGVTEDALSAPLRLKKVEEGLESVATEMKDNTTSVLKMAQRMNESNGTMRRIEGMVTEIKGFPTGATLPEVVDAVHTHDEKVATQQAEILQAITDKKESL